MSEQRLGVQEEQFRRDRRFIIRVGAGALGILLGLGYCGYQVHQIWQDEIEGRDGRGMLSESINGLPDSSIKDLLKVRVLPYFLEPPPFLIQRAGVDIRVHTSAVKVFASRDDSALLDGTASIKGIPLPRKYAITPIQSTTIKLPYLGLLSERERASPPPNLEIADDGTPFTNVTFSSDEVIHEWLTPLIQVYKAPSLFARKYPIEASALEKFVYVKEACSILLSDIWIEETIKKMRDLGFSTVFDALTSNGLVVKGDGLIHGKQKLFNGRSRVIAAHDIAAHLLAFKSVNGTPVVGYLTANHINMHANINRDVISEIRQIDFGTTASDILYNSLKSAITSPTAQRVDHIGDINKIP